MSTIQKASAHHTILSNDYLCNILQGSSVPGFAYSKIDKQYHLGVGPNNPLFKSREDMFGEEHDPALRGFLAQHDKNYTRIANFLMDPKVETDPYFEIRFRKLKTVIFTWAVAQYNKQPPDRVKTIITDTAKEMMGDFRVRKNLPLEKLFDLARHSTGDIDREVIHRAVRKSFMFGVTNSTKFFDANKNIDNHWAILRTTEDHPFIGCDSGCVINITHPNNGIHDAVNYIVNAIWIPITSTVGVKLHPRTTAANGLTNCQVLDQQSVDGLNSEICKSAYNICVCSNETSLRKAINLL